MLGGRSRRLKAELEVLAELDDAAAPTEADDRVVKVWCWDTAAAAAVEKVATIDWARNWAEALAAASREAGQRDWRSDAGWLAANWDPGIACLELFEAAAVLEAASAGLGCAGRD